MITDATLDLAVEKGLLAEGQAIALRSLARETQRPPRPEPVDEEKLRFVTGFADIFVTLGVALFLGAAAALLGPKLSDAASAATIAILAWGLAEFFTRRKRMALPSITLLVVFAGASFLTIGSLVGGGMGAVGLPRLGWLGVLARPAGSPTTIAVAALGTAVLAGLHYWRFRVPITIAAGVAALAATLLALVFVGIPDLPGRALNPILLALGLCIFALAMRFDLSDPGRVSRRTDIAFWLHLLASPLIVHSLFQEIGAGHGLVAPGVAVGIIAVFLALAAVAVLVDRRAMLVSGLVYAGVAFGSLISQAGFRDNTGIPITLLILGGFVLLLSAGWTPLRTAILSHLPHGFAERLPRPLSA